MKIYLDTCCWGRPQDWQGDAQVRRETDAILEIIKRRQLNGHIVVGSQFVLSELADNPDVVGRMADIEFFLNAVDSYKRVTDSIKARGRELAAQGLKGEDPFHLAAAEAAGVDALLTVDAAFLKTATNKKLSRVNVMSPLTLIGG